MENSMPKILIEIMVRRTLREIKEEPERNIRNMVDLALQFSKGSFQRRFLSIIQEMLEDENSAYYRLVRDVAANVDNDRLLNFGMNIGYNSCISGARKIREWESENGYHVPWTILLETGKDTFENYAKRYQSLIEEGERMGVYTWGFYMDYACEGLFSLIKAHPDSAFFLFCKAKDITEEVIDQILAADNLMPVIEYDEQADDVCSRLRDAKLLYGVFLRYMPDDMHGIADGELFDNIKALHPAATVLIPAESCSKDVQEQVYRMVLDARKSQKYPTIVWDIYGDNRLVDEIISDDSCCVQFNKEGDLCGQNKQVIGKRQVLLSDSLQQILKENFQKKTKEIYD